GRHADGGVDLPLEMVDAEVEIAALGVALRMAATDDAEVVAALTDEPDHIDGIAEAVRGTAKRGIGRDVAADGHDVLDPTGGDQVEMGRQLLARRLDAGDVRRALDAEGADARDQLDRRLARLATGARHRHEARTQGTQRLDRAHEGGVAVGGDRGEELERDAGRLARKDVGYFHASRPSGARSLVRALLLERLH